MLLTVSQTVSGTLCTSGVEVEGDGREAERSSTSVVLG